MNDPAPGTIWGGCGMTVRVLSVIRDGKIADVRVERLTGGGGVLKQPSAPAVITLQAFEQGRMNLLDLTKNDPWTRAVRERFASSEASAKMTP